MSTQKKERRIPKQAPPCPAVPRRTGWVITFPGIPPLWFHPEEPANAMLTLAAMVRNYQGAYGRVPRGAAVHFRQGYEEPVSLPCQQQEQPEAA